jgi:hypothetical protein
MATTPIYGYNWELPADLSARANQERLSPDAVRAFFKIAKLWNVKDEDARQLLGGISSSKFYSLKRDHTIATLNQDELTRTSFLVGIFKALNIIFDEELADAWIQLPNKNPIFGGVRPLQYIIHFGLPGMQLVRQLLDAYRGGR